MIRKSGSTYRQRMFAVGDIISYAGADNQTHFQVLAVSEDSSTYQVRDLTPGITQIVGAHIDFVSAETYYKKIGTVSGTPGTSGGVSSSWKVPLIIGTAALVLTGGPGKLSGKK